jgi:hypothetical protein
MPVYSPKKQLRHLRACSYSLCYQASKRRSAQTRILGGSHDRCRRRAHGDAGIGRTELRAFSQLSLTRLKKAPR